MDSAVERVAGVVSGAGIGVTVAGGKGLAVGFARGMWARAIADAGGVGRMAGSMGLGSSRRWRKMVAAEGRGSERVAPVKPSGTGMGLTKVGSMEMDWMRKRLEPVRVQSCVGSEGHCRNVRSGWRTRVARGSQSLEGGS